MLNRKSVGQWAGGSTLLQARRQPHRFQPGASHGRDLSHLAQLRDLTRYRRTLTHERTREKQRAEKLLEDAQIKLELDGLIAASGDLVHLSQTESSLSSPN